MRRICAWCGRIVEPGAAAPATHGICTTCRGRAPLDHLPGAAREALAPALAGDACAGSSRMPRGIPMSVSGSRDESARVRTERDLYRRLLELGRRDELDPFLKEALALVVELTGARHGYLELRDPGNEAADDVWSLAFGFSEPEVHDLRARVSHGIIGEALATGETVVTHSALEDERFRGRKSVQRERIESVLCAPLGGSGAHGVLYLQGRELPGPFSDEDREHAEIFARHLAPLADRLLIRAQVDRESDATRELRRRHELSRIVGRSEALAATLEQAMLAAPLDVTVLLTGPSGTGKTELARVIHANSRRAGGPLVEINCASLPESLIESELFGARAGSHSEARRDMPGKVAAAEGGTLFLDEVSELPAAAQAKLLQLLQSRRYFALGATSPSSADVRVIAASNADLEARVREKRFREDLFYRLNVLPVRLPSLAERRRDLRELSLALLARAVERHGLPPLAVSPAALHAIQAGEWPGNVRQLENAIEAAAVRAAGAGAEEIGVRHVFPERAAEGAHSGARATFQQATRAFQRDLLASALHEADWNVSEAARRLDLARSHVYQLIASFGLARTERNDGG
jgi:Nif-specific regulatory protein